MSEPDLRVISLGAGVQSSVLYIMACAGKFDMKVSFALFSDTKCERDETYRHLDRLEEMGGGEIPIIRTSAGNLQDDALRSMCSSPSRFLPIPAYCDGRGGYREGMGRRQCTRSHKLEPIHQEIRRQLGLKKGERAKDRFRVEVWIGITLDESHRARPSRYDILGYRWPFLIDKPMSRADCVRWFDKQGLQRPVKSSCWFCPFKSDADWLELQRDDPDAWEQAVAFDREINAEGHYLHVSLKPLDEAMLDPSKQMDLFTGECEGMCGV